MSSTDTNPNKGPLDGKVALVTGATRGAEPVFRPRLDRPRGAWWGRFLWARTTSPSGS
jgi:hypothetical protein